MIKKSLSITIAVITLLTLSLLGFSEEKGTKPPRIISTHPKNGSQDVDPSLKEISVTFSEPMMDKSWSWSYEDKNNFPEMTGQPYYAENYTKCILPVKLESKKGYVIWINTDKFKNFKSKIGMPAEPYRLVFKTR